MIKLFTLCLLSLHLYGLDATITIHDDVNKGNSVTTTKLATAIQNDRLDEARELISKGAYINSLNSREETPLLCAMRNAHYSFAKELIRDGADTSAIDIGGNSAFSYALKAGREDIALKVLQNPNFDIYQWVDSSVFRGRAYSYEYYIDKTRVDLQDYTLLHMAARHKMSKIVQALLDLGLDIDTLNKSETLAR